MSMRRALNNQSVTGNDHSGSDGESKAPAVFFLICAVGLFCLGRAVLDPGLEWRLLAMAALAFAMSPFSVDVHSRASHESIPLPLTHPALFAGAIALGPAGAALPAAFCGIARVLFGSDNHRPLHQVLYIILKPSVVCVAASLAYAWTGGSVLRPQAVASLPPLMCAGLVYVAASAALLGEVASDRVAAEAYHNTRVIRARPMVLAAAWSLCLLSGYMLAVLYSVAPTYVLIVPSVAAGLAGCALRQRTEETVEADEVIEESQKADGESKGEETSSFVDDLTGLANVRYLDMFLQREVSRAQRADKPLSVVVFDLDDFKHPSRASDRKATDQALVRMGEKLKSGLREYDLVARLAAGRLVVVLPETPAEEAPETAQRLHESITSLKVNRKPISVSAGVATLPDHADSGQELINAAHRALNQGRFAGPNAVHGLHNLRKAG